jgi:hypothetical protein
MGATVNKGIRGYKCKTLHAVLEIEVGLLVLIENATQLSKKLQLALWKALAARMY